MKKILPFILAAVCAALVFSSCETLDPNKDFDGTIYGLWVAETLEVEVETTINGNTTTSKSTTDFSKDYCRLNLDTSTIATLWYNLDLDFETFSFDESAMRITFKESLNAGDDGKAIVLLGIYDVQLTGDKMILSQPKASVGGTALGASERAVYTFHRAPKTEKPRDTESN